MVLLGGMTQTVSSWGGQLRPLSATRTVVAYETRGQGGTELSLGDVSLARQVEDAASFIAALDLPGPVDLCGFSFGGRVALAIAAHRPDLVRRLVLSGVARGRTVLARCILGGWAAALTTGSLEALARVSMADIVGTEYLEAHAGLVEPMVKAVVQRNSYAGIAALFRDVMQTDKAPQPEAGAQGWDNATLAAAVQCPALVMGGEGDRLAAPAEVAALAEAMGAVHKTFSPAGHTIPIEAAGPWREAVVDFLDASR